MTVKRTQVQLFVEEAPKDPFDVDGPQLYQVVAVDRAATTVWHLTDRHAARERAMDQLRRSIHASATRYELVEVDRHLGKRVQMLEARVEALYRWAGTIRSQLNTMVGAVDTLLALRKHVPMTGVVFADPDSPYPYGEGDTLAAEIAVSVEAQGQAIARDPRPDRGPREV